MVPFPWTFSLFPVFFYYKLGPLIGMAAYPLGSELHEDYSWHIIQSLIHGWCCKWNLVKLNIKESVISSLGEHSCQSVHVGSGPAKTFIPSPTQLQIFSDFLDHAWNPSIPFIPLASCSHLLKSKSSTLVFASHSLLSEGLQTSPVLAISHILTI